MLLDAVGCCWMLLDVAGCCWMLLDVVGCCWMPLDVIGCFIHRPGRSQVLDDAVQSSLVEQVAVPHEHG